MGILADRLDSMRVQAISADGQIHAELRNRAEVHLTFAEGAYRQYDVQTLADQLAGVAERLWLGYTKEYYAARSAAFGETVRGESPSVGSRDREFEAARDELVANGASTDGRLALAVQGMRNWLVRVAAGTTQGVTEAQFAADVREAAAALIADQMRQIRDLKVAIYQPPT